MTAGMSLIPERPALIERRYSFSNRVCLRYLDSEHQLQAKLNLAGTRDCAGDLARGGTDALARKHKEVRNTEVCPVGDVKCLGPEEQTRFFRDRYGLEDREINLRQARAI